MIKDAEFLQWDRMEPQHAEAIRAALIQRYRPRTVNKMLSALRGVLRMSWPLGYMDGDAYLRTAAIQNVEVS